MMISMNLYCLPHSCHRHSILLQTVLLGFCHSLSNLSSCITSFRQSPLQPLPPRMGRSGAPSPSQHVISHGTEVSCLFVYLSEHLEGILHPVLFVFIFLATSSTLLHRARVKCFLILILKAIL